MSTRTRPTAGKRKKLQPLVAKRMKGNKLITEGGGGSASQAHAAENVNIAPQMDISGPAGEATAAAVQMDVDVSCSILPPPTKSPFDKKEYRVIQLQNGLTALLISDLHRLVGTAGDEDEEDEVEDKEDLDEEEEEEEEELDEEVDEEMEDEEEEEEEEGTSSKHKAGACCVTKYKAAASLTIGIGSFEDPKEFPGLMHFLEHMVFMGSEKYPKENAFDHFIKKHGGGDNAHTDMEHTTFYFEIQERYLQEGLDRFAQFFINPLMRSEAMTRERKAVHSEFQMALPEDTYRTQQLFASFAAENHPMSKFAWGNESTLSVGISDDELHKKLHECRSRYYSSQHMTLTVQARLSLDKLQEYVCGIFSQIPNNSLPRPTYSHLGFPFPLDKLHRLYRVVPTKDYHSVEISWALPTMRKHYRVKPLHYVAHFLGHEGRGSMLSYLKKKVWAVGLYSGNDETGFEHNTTYAYLSISVELTDEGFKNVEKVIEVVFQYLAMIRGVEPVERIYREIQQIEQMSFDYAEEMSPVDNVEALSESMQIFPPENYLNGDTVLFDFDPEVISDCLRFLVPEKCNIIISSKSYKDQEVCNLTEEWFGTKYSVEDIPKSWEEKWASLPPNPDLHLPVPNIFIPDKFDLLIPETDVPEYPEKLVEEECGILWFRQDQKFKLPRTYCYVYLLTDLLLQSPKNAALLDLYLNLFTQQIMEDVYPADMAQYRSSVCATERGLVIKISGFNQKLPQLLDLLLHHMETFEDLLDEKTFSEIRQQQMKAYHNAILKPGVVRRDVRLSILQKVHWTAYEKLMEIKTITRKDLIEEFVSKLFPTCHLRVLIQGNTTASQAISMYNLVKDRKMKYSPVVPCPFPELRTMELQSGCWVARVSGINPGDTNSSVINYYQDATGSLKTEVLHEFIQMLMDEPVFDFLRTREQLGYNVFCTNRNTFGILGISITVNTQANKFSVCHVDRKIEEFLKEFLNTQRCLSDSDLSTMKETLISMKQTIDLTLREEVNRNWAEIEHEEYLFDRLQQQIELIKEITKEDAVKCLEGMVLSKDNPVYRKLSVQVVGEAEPKENSTLSLEELLEHPSPLKLLGPYQESKYKDMPAEHFIDDITQYKSKLKIYPITKIV